MQSGRASGLRGKRLRVEVLLAGATVPEPLPARDLVEADLWSQLPIGSAAVSRLVQQYYTNLNDCNIGWK